MDVTSALAVGAAAGVVLTGGAVAVATAARRTRVPSQSGPPPIERTDVRSAEEPSPGMRSTMAGPVARAGRREPEGVVPRDLVLDQLRAAVVVLDGTDAVYLANPAARRMGLLRPDGSGLAPTPLRSLVADVRRGGRARDVDLDLPRRGGDPLGVRVRVSLLDDGGHIAVEVEDVTELHRVARVRRDFVANVSHELKTPVGALQLLSEALLSAVDDPDAARRFTERIQHESTRLARLVGELIELSRLQGGEPLPTFEPVSVDRMVNEVLDRGRTAAGAKDIGLVRTGSRGLTVYGHEKQLVTALANLVENAVAYSPERTRITISTGRRDGQIALAVADEGIGIDAADVERIFERFYRADRARSRATGGTGLGLAIVKHIAANHRGAVDVASTPGQGSTFTLRLPSRPPTVNHDGESDDGSSLL